MRLPVPALMSSALLVAGCTSDQGITTICAHDEAGFDIEEASTLEDAQSYPGMHDAVILDFELPNQLSSDATWRIKAVEIYPMVDDFWFEFWEGGESVTVEVFDGDNPDAERFTVTQRLDKEALEWESVFLDSPSSTLSQNHQAAWWSFDFTQEIPQSGLSCTNCLVGVAWDSTGSPPVGYSNFNRPCDKNWTDYADGQGWVLNEGSSDTQCSWPMLRVTLEVLEERAQCDENTVQL